MIDFNVFKGGKSHAVTFSYDDGTFEPDKKLIEKLNAHSAKGTFHLNSGKYKGFTESQLDELRKMYAGHEVSTHTVNHGFLDKMPSASAVDEILQDRKNLEGIFGYIVNGMSYPFGAYNAEVMDIMRACGIVYSRTVNSTFGFPMPKNFLEWHPTCHHKSALECADKFIANLHNPYSNMLFYIWGHSYEFENDNNWELLDELLSKICGLDNVWYATNIEIYNYKMAQRQLLVSADESIIYNPTQTEVCIRRNAKEIIKVAPNETVRL